MTIVTASVDRIHLSSIPTLETDLVLAGKVTYVGTSSMEIRMQCRNEADDNENYWMEAFFTFVATDPETKRPMKIPPLKTETLLEEQQFVAGKRRAAAKKKARQNAKSHASGDTSGKFQAIAEDLLEQAGPVINMPGISSPDSILVSQTELHNCELAQPQTRNLASQIFGGFLMRRACELAFNTAYVFGGARPTFYEVDEVSFGMPVNVGDLLKFQSRMLYTNSHCGTLRNFEGLTQTVSLEVEAWVIDPVKSSAKLSNQFYFTFALPSDAALRRVLPSNMEEARKIAKRMEADHKQEEQGK
jgi:acyl-coenzyme A thioesterase 9